MRVFCVAALIPNVRTIEWTGAVRRTLKYGCEPLATFLG